MGGIMAKVICVQCPVFKEAGYIKITVPFGEKIKNYPQKGQSNDHWGNDIVRSSDGKASELATIISIEDGVIEDIKKTVEGFDKNQSAGNYVKIRHPNGFLSKYFHLKYGSIPQYFKKGMKIPKGTVIGYMGSTGHSYGAHLHFQIDDENGAPVDPEPYLKGGKTLLKLDNIPDAYAKSSVEWAVEKGILIGTTNGDLKLHENVTRQDLMVFLDRALNGNDR